MKKFTKITLIIVAILTGLGIVFCGIGAAMGAGVGTVYNMAREGKFNTGNWHFDRGISWSTDWDDSDWSSWGDWEDWDDDDVNWNDGYQVKNHTIAAQNEYEVSEISEIYLDVYAIDINVKTDASVDNIKIKLMDGKADHFTCTTDAQKLTVKYDAKNVEKEYSSAYLEVILPSSYTADLMDVKAGAGDVYIDENGLTVKDMKISMGAGDFNAFKLNVIGDLDISAGAGDVNILDSTYQDVTIDAGVGDATLEGTLNGDLTGSCGVGELDLTLKGKESDYNYELSCGLGEMEINGSCYSNIGGKKVIENDGAEKTLSLDCGVGCLTVEIE